MHSVRTITEIPFQEPEGWVGHCRGYSRASVVDAATEAVHSGLGVCRLEAAGWLNPHVHSHEEAFFVLEGRVLLSLDGRAYELGPQDYGIIQVGAAHGWRAVGSGARWFEINSPQPRVEPQDTFFFKAEPPVSGERPDFADPTQRWLGHFDDIQMPPPSHLQMDGYSGGNVEGISLKMMVDRVLGAQHLTMFMVEFQPGGAGNVHDHPLEECYFLLAGEADALLDGERYHVRAGDVVWTSVGGTHGFFNTGSVPVRWIETQAPQPPGQQAFRFARDWEHLAQKLTEKSPG
ncbi:MAG TPA: cupin domain-containing protein [Candidatus Acidoferrales bacterium]|nr:cupin domain-containing protein [Candidatus Acidoferrales bacterium]